MRLRSAPGLTTQRRASWSIWISSTIFSLVILGGYRNLEEREFLLVVAFLALFHLLTVVTLAVPLSWHLFLSQSSVVVMTLVSVLLHVSHVVGAPPPDLSRTFGSFLQGAITSLSTYLYFAGYLAAFCLVLTIVLLAIRALRLRLTINAEATLVTAYAMSSVNVAFDYCLTRPLYHVSGEPDAVAFFFTAGLFGVEFSLALHLLLLAVCLLWHRLIRRPSVRGECRGSTSASTAVLKCL